ncbi:MAG: hypothetical protein ACRDJC_00360 [Thermomicrobiales bacterium]
MHRLAVVQAAAVSLIVLVALPFAFRSMGAELMATQQHALYVFPDGAPITEQQAGDEPADLSYYNIAAVEMDEATGSLTFAISGHRNCGDDCPKITLTVVSLNNDSHYRRALPPSASIELAPEDRVYTQTVDLPIRGRPSLYPFDTYWIWLGLAGTVEENGETSPLTPELLAEHAVITTQNQLRDFTMTPPRAIDPARVAAPTDPYEFFGVQELRFDRPVHQEILTALLISLVGVSAITAVAMRDITDLVFGIGGIILAVWGVKRVLVPDPLPVLTTVDMALSVIILLVLVGLSIRAAWQVSTGSGPPLLPGRRQPK